MFLLTAYYVIFYMYLLFTLWRMNKYQISINHHYLVDHISAGHPHFVDVMSGAGHPYLADDIKPGHLLLVIARRK